MFQDLALVPGMTVSHNMFLNRELAHGLGPVRFLANRAMRKRSLEYLDDIGVRVPSISAEVARMSGGQRQAIAIARSTHSDAKILLLDEPLAAMGAREGALIIELIEELKKHGDVSMIVIAHNYVHVLEMCDRVNLLEKRPHHARQTIEETSVEELTRSSRPSTDCLSPRHRDRKFSRERRRLGPSLRARLGTRGTGRTSGACAPTARVARDCRPRSRRGRLAPALG